MATSPASTEATQFQPRERFISLLVRAGEVFASREKALESPQTANPSLRGEIPLDAAGAQEGFEQADDILTRIEHGVLGGRRHSAAAGQPAARLPCRSR